MFTQLVVIVLDKIIFSLKAFLQYTLNHVPLCPLELFLYLVTIIIIKHKKFKFTFFLLCLFRSWTQSLSSYSPKKLIKNFLIRFVILCGLLFIAYHLLKYLVEVTGLREHVDPHALLGYFHCSINSTEIRHFPCDFLPKPNASGVLVVTFVNAAWLPLARNWICSATKVGIRNKLYLISFEKNVCSKLPSDIPCYEHTSIEIHGTTFGQPEYQKLVIERTKIILKLLNCGQQRVALVDADITFLGNPFNYLEDLASYNDIMFQADSSGLRQLDAVVPYFFKYICGGFIYMKANYATRYLWRAVLEYQTTFKWNDQAGLNICIRHHKQTASWAILDAKAFPNGKQYFFYKQRSAENLIVHANHLEGNDKIMRMIESNVWCDTEYAKQFCAERNSTCVADTARECVSFKKACKKF